MRWFNFRIEMLLKSTLFTYLSNIGICLNAPSSMSVELAQLSKKSAWNRYFLLKSMFTSLITLDGYFASFAHYGVLTNKETVCWMV